MIADFDLTGRNTFGLASHARHGAVVTRGYDIGALADFAASHNLPLRVIGGGSNIVPRERVDAVVGVMALNGRTVTQRDETILVTAGAGEDWPSLVEWTVEQGLGGLENLAGIPGTVGAAPVQNIGAYGLELADRFHILTAYDVEKRSVRSFRRQDCGFGYRQSIFKGSARYIILNVTLALPRVWLPILTYRGLDTLPMPVSARDVMDRVLALRREKLPDWRTLGNAGSFFHNPVVWPQVAASIPGVPRYPHSDGAVKLSAAWLIEACGLRGYREGKAGVYDRHALILVNHGGATFTDISALASTIRAAVMERFGIALVQEPVTI